MYLANLVLHLVLPHITHLRSIYCLHDIYEKTETEKD